MLWDSAKTMEAHFNSRERGTSTHAPLVTVTGYSKSGALALAETIRARGGQFTEDLWVGCSALVVHRPFTAQPSEKVRAARRSNIPCVTEDWVTRGGCAVKTLDAFDLRHSVRGERMGVMGLSTTESQQLQDECGCVCQPTLDKRCRVLIGPDPDPLRRYSPNQRKLDFARTYDIPYMTMSQFLLCYGGSAMHEAPMRLSSRQASRYGMDGRLAAASCAPTPPPHRAIAPRYRPSLDVPRPSLTLDMAGGVDTRWKRSRDSSQARMEPMTDVCVWCPTQDATLRHEVARLVEDAGARLATSPADPDMTHIVLDDAVVGVSPQDGSPCFLVDTASFRPGLEYVRLRWLVDCVTSRHRISCLPYRVPVRTSAASSAVSVAAMPVLAFTTLDLEEMRNVRACIARAGLPAVVQDVVYRRRHNHHPSSAATHRRADGLQETTHLLAPPERVGSSTKVKVLHERFSHVPGGIPVLLVDVTWATDSAAHGAWLPCDSYTIPWPGAPSAITSARPSDGLPSMMASSHQAPQPLARPSLPPVVSSATTTTTTAHANGVDPVPDPSLHAAPREKDDSLAAPASPNSISDTNGVAARVALAAQEVEEADAPERKRPKPETANAPPFSQAAARVEQEEPSPTRADGSCASSSCSSTAPGHAAATPTAGASSVSLEKVPIAAGKTPAEEEEARAPSAAASADEHDTEAGSQPPPPPPPPVPVPALERYETETMAMSLQQRWEDMEAFVTGATAHTGVLGAPALGVGLGLLGEDDPAGSEPEASTSSAVVAGGGAQAVTVPPALPLPTPSSPRGAGSGIGTPMGRTSFGRGFHTRAAEKTAAPVESQQVVYNHTGGLAALDKARDDGDDDVGKARGECWEATAAEPPAAVLLYVEESLRRQGAVVQAALEANAHWQLVTEVKDCTHFVTGKLMSSVQFLCCMAAGKWVLQPSFLLAAGQPAPLGPRGRTRGPAVEAAAHQWTREAAERQNLKHLEVKLAAGCALNRRLAQAVAPNSHVPFALWKVTLTCSATRFACFRRVLETGGCLEVTQASAEQLVRAASVPAPKRGVKGRKTKLEKPVAGGDDGEHFILSDEADWELEQLEAYLGTPAAHPVLMIDYVLNYLCTQNPFEERDTVLYRKHKTLAKARGTTS